MNCANQTLRVIENGMSAICSHFSSDPANMLMTDIILQANGETGAFSIFDDDDNEIFSDIVEEWIGTDSEDFYTKVESLLRKCIQQHADQFKDLSIIKPYSFILIDDEKETVSELYIVDDDTIVFDTTSLMQNLDTDLDNFFDKLKSED